MALLEFQAAAARAGIVAAHAHHGRRGLGFIGTHRGLAAVFGRRSVGHVGNVLGALAQTESDDSAQPVRNALPKVGRNDPCPCGSGKKYKQCHGKLV